MVITSEATLANDPSRRSRRQKLRAHQEEHRKPGQQGRLEVRPDEESGAEHVGAHEVEGNARPLLPGVHKTENETTGVKRSFIFFAVRTVEVSTSEIEDVDFVQIDVVVPSIFLVSVYYVHETLQSLLSLFYQCCGDPLVVVLQIGHR